MNLEEYLEHCGGTDRLVFPDAAAATVAVRRLRARAPESVAVQASYNTVLLKLQHQECHK